MQRDALFFVLCLVVFAGLLITQASRTETKSVTTENKAPVPAQDKTVLDKPEDSGLQEFRPLAKGA